MPYATQAVLMPPVSCLVPRLAVESGWPQKSTAFLNTAFWWVSDSFLGWKLYPGMNPSKSKKAPLVLWKSKHQECCWLAHTQCSDTPPENSPLAFTNDLLWVCFLYIIPENDNTLHTKTTVSPWPDTMCWIKRVVASLWKCWTSRRQAPSGLLYLKMWPGLDLK